MDSTLMQTLYYANTNIENDKGQTSPGSCDIYATFMRQSLTGSLD